MVLIGVIHSYANKMEIKHGTRYLCFPACYYFDYGQNMHKAFLKTLFTGGPKLEFLPVLGCLGSAMTLFVSSYSTVVVIGSYEKRCFKKALRICSFS